MAKYHGITLGQAEAVFNKVGGEEGVRKLLAGELKVVPADSNTKQVVARRPKLLAKDGYYSAVTLTGSHNPAEYYRNQRGLYVYSDFSNRIVSEARPTKPGKRFKKVSRFKLVVDATGDELRSERPNSVWKATDFCPWIAAKLANQPNGEEGELLNTGAANLSLVEGYASEVFVVDVHWYSDYRKWYVNTWRLDNTWDAGRSFASCN